STFTYVQAPFSVHADLSAGDAAMRDSARFHFGFTVPFVPHMGAASVVAAVSDSKGDLGLVPAFPMAGAGAWWSALEFDSAPKIIARLPFVERADHPAAIPVFVVSRAAPEAMVKEVEVWSMRVAGWSAAAAQAVLAETVAVPDRAFDGAALLISVPQGGTITEVIATLVKAGASVRASALVGSHATRYRVKDARPVPPGRRFRSAECPSASDRNRGPACSPSIPTCRARARRPASRACSSCRRTRPRSAPARRRLPPITRSRSICRIIPTGIRPRCARRSD